MLGDSAPKIAGYLFALDSARAAMALFERLSDLDNIWMCHC